MHQANLICSSLSQLIGQANQNHALLVETYWQEIKAAALNAHAAIELDKINIAKPNRAGQKLKRIAQINYPRYRHDKEIMALLYLGALRSGFIKKPPKRLTEKKYRSILFELLPAELRNSAAAAYNAGLTTQSVEPIVALDKGGRPNGRHFIDYAKSILAIYKSASNENLSQSPASCALTNVVFLNQCLAPSFLANHPFISTASMIERASL
jgi:hypothetical protein